MCCRYRFRIERAWRGRDVQPSFDLGAIFHAELQTIHQAMNERALGLLNLEIGPSKRAHETEQ